VTCLREEVDAVADWLDEHGSAAHRLPLPVPEQDLRGAGPDYRWTRRAWADYQRRAIRELATMLAGRRTVVPGAA
jgi:hypothetical protein